MAEAMDDELTGDEKHPYEEYGVDLRFMGIEAANRVVNFISAKPDERQIRSIHVRSDWEYSHSAYYYLNELLWLFESPRTPYDILLVEPSRLRKLVSKLRALSFEGSWLDDVEKLLDINLENTYQCYLDDLRRLEKKLKESSDRVGEEIELLIRQKCLAEDDDHGKISEQLLQIIQVKKNVN